ncbi:CRISPR-associated helicase Cas3' [Klebsiella pneumoniae]|uniref:CRISPR-associated helicase Cas3' n=1 Tax=Klebsiella pneumoniae TaxID=573 RepID=UPI001034648F|nr:CRISPR-associated helicase Cas3' [Klebsiella pneumoniae]MCM5987441.1 CRISPR-associated helicase Cas3' [Klebsiella pneumoniae]TYX09320.1 CRISPR-associated helicase Cas3' [Klebsiella pneumoniae]HBQ5504167.1 CRISPR-associated helicase Cas3' [Klebsiella pneumoniae]HBR1911693.1 CRISPR-associated helicase Cas3' [Klebsiella pneumoniae]HBT5556270.1 CRISPR-associated helicase Cas3' [Klebsiella pneumoniae]
MRRLIRVSLQNQHAIAAISFENCPAKTRMLSDGRVVQGRSVLSHCQIVGEIARALIALYPEPMRSRLFPAGSEMAAAGHDIGKVSPTFAAKIFAACDVNDHRLAGLSAVNPGLETLWGGHAGVSQATAESLHAPRYVPEILGQHHGFNPGLNGRRGDAEVFGGPLWFDERKKLVDKLKAEFSADWPTFDSAAQARVVAGLTSVADWIGSGEFFENPEQAWQPVITAALNNAGFIKPVIRQGLSFADVFFPDDPSKKPREAQSRFIDQVVGPGLYILEAQMGMGKTEAALYAAYQMLVQEKATGIYFALPTQLTSNKIYDRFNSFLHQIVSTETPQHALLLHSGAWLMDTEMGEEGSPGGAWFNHRKRGLLAPFAVGTIDQALMAVMNVKHGFVRAYGLAGKVVILDEVHTYDLYTGTILNALVEFLRQIDCTVIILSATLSQTRRDALLQQSTTSEAYPLITAAPSAERERGLVEIGVPVTENTTVILHSCRKDESAREEALRRAELGQQVLWIENTIAEAQQTYLDLASRAVEAGCETGLLHSRFTPQHRNRHEQRWVALYGRAGWPQRKQCGRILVGTQVLEQSLDIDADFLVSRFAPTDMLLQRLGRLWRHTDTPRHASAKAECWLLSPSLESALANPGSAFGMSAMVYSPYVLCRSLEVWQAIPSLSLPGDIRPLIDQTYTERAEEGTWATLLHELKNGSRFRSGEQALQSLAKLTLSTGGKTLPEHKAETRYSDRDTHDLLLLCGLRTQDGITYMRLLDGAELTLPHGRHRLSRAQWRQLAVVLNQQLVRVSPAFCPPTIAKSELEKLHLQEVFYLGRPEDDEALLRVAIVSPAGELKTLDGRPAGDKYTLEYSEYLGFRAISKKE